MSVGCSFLSRLHGSVYAGALGDALGAPVEMKKLAELKARFGEAGVAEMVPYNEDGEIVFAKDKKGVGVVTDDTCMTVAVAAGLLTAYKKNRKFDQSDALFGVHQAFMKWGLHQVERGASQEMALRLDESLAWPEWFAPFWFESGAGKNTLRALAAPSMGTVENPLLIQVANDPENKQPSNGCGGMMRAAAAGWFSALGYGADAYDLGCRVAAITHGGRVAQTTSGGISLLVDRLVRGSSWERAKREVLKRMEADPLAAESVTLAHFALKAGDAYKDTMDFDTVETLPQVAMPEKKITRPDMFQAPAVWVQTLAIVEAAQNACGAVPEKMHRALTLAVTQSGDSDSVACIVGHVLGAAWGEHALPVGWVDKIQERQALRDMVFDLKKNSPRLGA